VVREVRVPSNAKNLTASFLHHVHQIEGSGELSIEKVKERGAGGKQTKAMQIEGFWGKPNQGGAQHHVHEGTISRKKKERGGGGRENLMCTHASPGGGCESWAWLRYAKQPAWPSGVHQRGWNSLPVLG